MNALALDNKTVVLTGAGSGVGRGYAIGFCADGARVLGMGRTEADLEETARLCGGRMSWVVGDVSDPDDVARLFAKARADFGHVDILVNNAATYPKRAFLDSPPSEWLATIATNVNGVALCCHAALPDMLERGHGRIINIGSFAWCKPIPNSAAYSASKGAVHSFTLALASEVDSTRYPDVLINELVPGMVRTRMSDQGEDPKDVYRHVRFVASLPARGAHGQTFNQSTMEVAAPRRSARLKRLASKLTGGLVGRG
jgi:NAD(P)-dependent dehydrogenase (short-subunit alcohol dehydrogenase family)